MTASDYNGPQFDLVYRKLDDWFYSRPHHQIVAESGGQQAGSMLWSSKEVRHIEVAPKFQRQGLATRMWQEGHRIADESTRVPTPKHSADRTDAGDAWAKSVGGRLPRRTQSED